MARPQQTVRSVSNERADLNTFAPGLAAVASAVHYKGKAPRIFVPPKPWQQEAYRHYGICGEARFAAHWIANALSKVKLFPIESLDTKKRLTSGPAVEAVADLFAGPNGQTQMMQALGLHLTIAGEAYIVGRQVDAIAGFPGKADLWEVLAVTEIQVNGESWSITDPEDATKADIPLTENDVVIRVWRPDPAKRRDADSPFKSLIPVLAEIEWLTRHIFAQCMSRLAGAGLLFVNDGIEIAEPPRTDGNGNLNDFANKATALMTALAAGMMRPLNDPSSPESLVPLILTVPEELLKTGGKVAELMHFWSDLDDKALDMRRAAIDRFADGMDIPAEKLRGLSTSPSTGGGRSTGPNHWGMWQIDEEAITIHIEPLAELVCNFLTFGYLNPLNARPNNEALWYDTAALRLRPDRSKESLELYDRGLLKGEVVLKENRFDPDTEMMDEEERRIWLVCKIATGTTSATPEQVGAALKLIGVDLGVPPESHNVPQEKSRDPKPVPGLGDHPTRDIPEAAKLLLTVCEPLVLRALERAGNRLRQKVRNTGGYEALKGLNVKAYNVHTVVMANGSAAECLEDAFGDAAELCLEGIADAGHVIPVLHGYVATIMAEQSPHTRERLSQWLAQAELVAS